MQYQVTDKESQRAKNPHHIYNLNIILTHLFLSLTVLKTTGNPVMFILIPAISLIVLGFIYYKTQQKIKDDTWFVAAHWMLAWRRGRILIGSYMVGLSLVAIYSLSQWLMPGGMSMNNFSDDGSSTPIFQVITMFFGGAVVFFTVLITFLQTGISVYDCSKGIVDKNLAKYLPRDEKSNIELGEYDDKPTAQKPPTEDITK
jgi:RsiW-degrading membrane proteinase PrsW (M82 family)